MASCMDCLISLAVQDGRHYHLWLLSTLNVLSILDKLSFKMHLILINLNACMWLESTILDSAGLEHRAFHKKIYRN